MGGSGRWCSRSLPRLPLRSRTRFWVAVDDFTCCLVVGSAVQVVLCYRRNVSDTRHHATARVLPHRRSRDGDLLRQQAASWRFCCWLQSSMDHVLVTVGNARRPCRPRMCCTHPILHTVHTPLAHPLVRPSTQAHETHARVRPARRPGSSLAALTSTQVRYPCTDISDLSIPASNPPSKPAHADWR